MNEDTQVDTKDSTHHTTSDAMLTRLSSAVNALESLLAQQSAIAAAAETPAEKEAITEAVDSIVATAISAREEELEARLAAAEETIHGLRASAVSAGRKTAITASANRSSEAVDAASLDAALSSLSIEQRFAVKSEMLRSGLLR